MGEQSTMEGGTEMSTVAVQGGGGSKDKSGALILVGLCCLLLLAVGIIYSVFGAQPIDVTEDKKGEDKPNPPVYASSPPSSPPSDKTTKSDQKKTSETMITDLPTAAPTDGMTTDEGMTPSEGTSTTAAPQHTPPPTPPPPGPTPPPTTATKETATTTTTTTTTKAPFSVSEMVCTVSERAIMPYMIPTDGICTFLYYSDVIASAGKLHGTRTDYSWRAFQREIRTRSKTQGGISFDIRYVDVKVLNDQKVSAEINALAGNNVKHYGLLTVVTHSSKLAGLVTKAINVIEKLKSMQGNDKNRKTIIALGLYDYSVSNAWGTYQSQFKAAVERSKADTVVALSSTGWQESDKNCFAAPPTSIDPANKRFPDLKKHATLVTRNVKYSRAVTLGLSFELGSLLYKFSENKTDVKKIPFASCIRSGTTHRDVPCKLPSENLATAYYGTLPNDTNYAFAFDSAVSLKDKFNTLKSSIDLPPKMSWLLNNVHLGSYVSDCTDKHFFRIENLKREVFKL